MKTKYRTSMGKMRKQSIEEQLFEFIKATEEALWNLFKC